jgi:alpha-L-rhamnosidase
VYLVPYRCYLRFGDPEILRTHWDMIKRYADYLVSKQEKDGHYEKGVHLGEWLEPEEFRDKVYGAKTKHPEECTAYLYLAMTTLAEIASVLGEPDEEYLAAAAAAKHVYTKYAGLDTDRQAKLVRPLALGLLAGDEKKKVQARLLKAVEAFNFRVGTGFLSTPFLLGELTSAGDAETAYRVLLNPEKPGWLYEVTQGATTVWETWEGYAGRGDTGSLNHYSPGAVCVFLFDTVCGIEVSGENRFTIRPLPGGSLCYAEARYDSPYGRVCSRWERTEEGDAFQIEIPSNTEAELTLPDGRHMDLSAGSYSFPYNK